MGRRTQARRVRRIAVLRAVCVMAGCLTGLAWIFVASWTVLVGGLAVLLVPAVSISRARCPSRARKLRRFTRHVPFYANGRGATFRLRMNDDGSHSWQWEYDSGIPVGFMNMQVTNLAITMLERELCLPLTRSNNVGNAADRHQDA